MLRLQDPSPTPTPFGELDPNVPVGDDVLPPGQNFAEALEILTFELALLAILLLTLFGSFAWSILRAGRLPQPGALVTALSLLTFIALLGFIFTQAESLVALASAGVGAIAGAVSSQFKDKREESKGPEDEGPAQ